ncbi:MAG: acyltransferase family protein [Burkholderiales bacterium]|nr:acyltransferase family protein [Burkholderiales bacterium]
MRRYDLDWLRVAAFGLLIGYHVGMLYVPWNFHVKSEYRGGPGLTALMLASNPWRLPLLFVISGAATAFMAQGLGRGALAWQRLKRLLIPLVFGMAVVVVPQVYFEVSEAGRYSGSFMAFWGRYLAGDQSFRTPIPTWNHLWFVAYLLVYTLIVVTLAPKPRAVEEAPAEPSRAAIVALLLGPWFVLWVLRMTLFPLFGSNHAMVRDWYDHTLYFGMFLFGFTLVRQPALWLAIDRLRWPALVLAVLGALVFIGLSLGWGEAVVPAEWRLAVGRAGREAQAWGAVLAALGFGQRHLNRDHRWRAYLVDVIFAYYIVHQTALIAFAVWLKPLQLGGALEGALVIGGTAIACVVTAEVARRVAWLRPLFGFRPEQRALSRPSPQTP